VTPRGSPATPAQGNAVRSDRAPLGQRPAGALDVAVAVESPRHYVLRGLYGALILGAGKIIARRPKS
jgi:hypothetical protein